VGSHQLTFEPDTHHPGGHAHHRRDALPFAAGPAHPRHESHRWCASPRASSWTHIGRGAR